MAVTVQTSTSNIDDWLQNHLQNVAGQAADLTGEPYSPYTGERIAGLSPLQQQALYRAEHGGGEYGRTQMNQAAFLGLQGAQDPTAAGIGRYMDPYESMVTQNIAREMRRQNEIGGIGEAAAAASAGAFGGSRHGVVEAERGRNFQRALMDMIASQKSRNYGQALQQYNVQQGIDLQASDLLGQLGLGMQQHEMTGQQQRVGLGALQQGQAQSDLDFQYQQFLEGREWPFKTTGFYSDVLQGVPYGQSATSSTTTPDPSLAQKLLGYGLGAASIYGALKG